ncbi:50S ribosomal protein L32 [Bacteroidota bacterium]|nr:50S ribosomal protein L32 [Bacteroidota bacterium]
MAHPKRKTSKTRRDKRRTHVKASSPQVAIDKASGEPHLYHRAHWHEGKLYYKGKVLIDEAENIEE